MNIVIYAGYMHSNNVAYHLCGLCDALVVVGILQRVSCDAGHVTSLLRSSEGHEL